MDYFAVLAGTAVIVATAAAFALYIVFHTKQELRSKRRENEILREKQVLEDKLQVSKRMTVIGALAGGMNYYLNSTLFSIGTLMDLLDGELQEKTKLRNLSKMITREITQGLRVTEALTQLAHPQKMALRPIPVAELAVMASERFRGWLPKSIRLETHIPSDHVTILGDESLLRQALHNLLINAVDAMPDGGLLTVTVANNQGMAKGEEAQGNTVQNGKGLAVISVTDTGMGMNEENRGRVFEPFFSTKSRPDRLGIGLSFIYGIARFHDGHIEIQSEKDKGTTAFLSIPAVDPERLGEYPTKPGEEGFVLNESLTLEERLQLMRGFVGET